MFQSQVGLRNLLFEQASQVILMQGARGSLFAQHHLDGHANHPLLEIASILAPVQVSRLEYALH